MGRQAQAHFFRTSDGADLDLVLEVEGERWAVEIKLTSNPSPGSIARRIEGRSLLVTNLAGWLRRLRA